MPRVAIVTLARGLQGAAGGGAMPLFNVTILNLLPVNSRTKMLADTSSDVEAGIGRRN